MIPRKAAEDDTLGSTSIPLLTNLAVFVHQFRPDLQAEFPDIFDLNRLGYAAWFLRYAGYEHRLDRCFLTPVALSWIGKSATGKLSLAARVRRVFGAMALVLSSWIKSLRPAAG